MKSDKTQYGWPNLEIAYMASCAYSNLKSFGENRIQNIYCTHWLKLDDIDDEKITQKLGAECFEDKSHVEIFLVGRVLNYISSKHWAWLIRFKNHADYEYATIEYTDKGIGLGLYSHNLRMSMHQVCTTILGDSSSIECTDEFETDKNWGAILKRCVQLRQIYTGKSYSLLGLNCRKFVRDLGNFFTPKFASSRFDQHGDFEFSQKLSK